jgi:hypothetical protein
MSTVRWNIAVSQDTDQTVRMFLINQGGDLSQFVNLAVRTHILKLTIEQAKTENANISESDLSAIIEEAVAWARD